MDAAELMSRLADPSRRPRAQIVERRAPGTIDAGQPEHVDQDAISKPAPSVLSQQSPAAAIRDWSGHGVLIDPGAAARAIDTGCGQVADPSQLRSGGDRIAVTKQHRVA